MEYLILGTLVLASIIGLTFIIERGIVLRANSVMPVEIKSALQTNADIPSLRRVCEAHPSPLGRLILFSEAHSQWPKAENITSLETRARHEVSKLERGLVILEIVVGIGPLLGLVGTIFGLITLFATMGETGPGNTGDLARGIATALYATLFGLLTAIPSLVAWSYYSRRVESYAVEMASLCEDFMRRLYYHSKDKAVPAKPTAETAAAVAAPESSTPRSGK
jgi:biopolymer transport protein ExbB